MPLAAELRSWLEGVLVQLSAKSGLAKAIHYALVRWVALTRFCDDGAIEIDNNRAGDPSAGDGSVMQIFP